MSLHASKEKLIKLQKKKKILTLHSSQALKLKKKEIFIFIAQRLWNTFA